MYFISLTFNTVSNYQLKNSAICTIPTKDGLCEVVKSYWELDCGCSQTPGGFNTEPLGERVEGSL